MYTATFYTAQDVSGRFCPWCIADGSAAERFEGDFTDSYGLDGVSEETLEHVTRRTPGFHAWQDPHWLVHCNDAAAFIGEVGYAELAAHPEALDQLRTDLRIDGWHNASQLENFLTHLGQGQARCSSAAPSAAPTSPTPTRHSDGPARAFPFKGTTPIADREAGATWATMGEALGLSADAARARYG
ncbi:CbrC family protein, partial [Kitasatospora aureofaciens]